MFDERTALKIRLEQMYDAEERILEKLRKERAEIFNRLRELDLKSTTNFNINNLHDHLETKNEHQSFSPPISRSRRGYPSRRSKTMRMRDIAIECLKEVGAPIRGSELQRKIEERAENRITNMTTFMSALQKTDENIIKLGRGLYTYRMNRENDTEFTNKMLNHSNQINEQEL